MVGRAALRITAIYVALAVLWIVGSDRLLLLFVPDAVSRYYVSVGKGLAFVSITGLVLFLLVRAQLSRLEEQRKKAQDSLDTVQAQDVELRATLEEKQRLYVELEARTERGRSLEAQLRQAQKMEGIGRLAGGVAHDFNNMLTVILSAAELLSDEVEPGSSAAGLVQEIKNAAERCAALTRQLLIFSRKQVARVEVLDLGAQVSEARKMLLRLIGEDIQFSAHLETHPTPVLIDPVHLQQLVVNLVVNARDAMPSGGSLVLETETRVFSADELSAYPGLKPGPFVILSLTDTGTGMSPETLEHIFEPFFTTKPEGKGTGLGLATVYQVVQQAGGFLKVNSKLGQGTAFRVHFPLAEKEAAQVGQRIERASSQGHERVLLVEDEESLRTMMAHSLRRQGYTVLEAKNAGEALLLAEQSGDPIELMVADVVMPIMRGTALAARLRELKPELRILLMSGYAEDLESELGRTAFLQKPFTADVLAAQVRLLLDAPGPVAGGVNQPAGAIASLNASR